MRELLREFVRDNLFFIGAIILLFVAVITLGKCSSRQEEKIFKEKLEAAIHEKDLKRKTDSLQQVHQQDSIVIKFFEERQTLRADSIEKTKQKNKSLIEEYEKTYAAPLLDAHQLERYFARYADSVRAVGRRPALSR